MLPCRNLRRYKRMKRSPINPRTFETEIRGMVLTEKEIQMSKKLEVRFTSDDLGETLSIADPDGGIMLAIPFEPVRRMMQKLEKMM